MDKQKIIEQVAAEVKSTLLGEGSGHDWWHILRVWNMAKHLAKVEVADNYIVELAALLHDISDWKFNNGDDSVGPKIAGKILFSLGVEEEIIKQIQDIILHLSYKGAGVKTEMKTIEGKIVQDADRLDAIGAIGIARTFAYGGSQNRELHNPEIKPTLHQTKEEYFNNRSSTINHFYEKLLLLKDLMNTESAKKIAQDRHEFMEIFLKEFFNEWKGEK